jgi:transposase
MLLSYKQLEEKFAIKVAELTETKAELTETKAEFAEMKAEFAETKENLAKAESLLKHALARIVKLEEQINKNSKNSSKPPSTDQKSNTPKKDPEKRAPRSGHHRTLYPPESVDQQVQCRRDVCPHCQEKKLKQLSQPPFVWQQVELPDVQAIVTQFNCLKYQCKKCGSRCIGTLPEGTPFSAFGPRLMAYISYLTGRFHVSKREAMTLVKDLYNVDLSEGSVINIEENMANALEEVYEKIHHLVIDGSLPRHFDETPWRDSGKRHYVWIGTTQVAAYYKIDPSRSTKAFLKVIGESTLSPSVTDRYSVYNILDGPRQYCLAHLIRTFCSYGQKQGRDGEVGKKIESELRRTCATHTKWKKGLITKRQRGCWLRHHKRRLYEYFIDALAFGSDELCGLCYRLIDKFEHLWTFASIKDMDPTNNMAERDLRKLVLWRKKSYGTRSHRGQKFVERITSVVETLKKHDQRVFKFLEQTIRAFYHKQKPPGIAPALGI